MRCPIGETVGDLLRLSVAHKPEESPMEMITGYDALVAVAVLRYIISLFLQSVW